jgi:hypothetical protein
MRSAPVTWTVGPIAVLTAVLVGLSSCGAGPVRPPPARSGYPTLTVAPAVPPLPSAAVSPPVTGRSPATTTIAG